MAKMFNPPPTWPAPPAGWAPDPGWRPDPAWGPAPAGWQLWVRANRHPFLRSFAVTAVCAAVFLATVSLTVHLTAYWWGYLSTPFVCVGVVVGFVARASARPWSWAGYVKGVLLGLLVVVALQLPRLLRQGH